MRAWELPDEVDERLKEWAHFFRDRRRLEHCKSIEYRFRPTSDDFAAEGWGDHEESAPKRKAYYRIERALQTHDAVQRLDRSYKWALTYWFAYPSFDKWRVLKGLHRFTGRRVKWRDYEELVDIGRMRVWAGIVEHEFGNRFAR